MKIYFLRHEKRNRQNPTFYSPLLEEGLIGSNLLIDELEKLDINVIFSSPFKRCLQTVQPFCNKKKMKVNIEYSLYEQIYNDKTDLVHHDPNDFKKDLVKSDSEYYLKNKKYSSFTPLEQIEFDDMAHKRANKFFKYIVDTYKNSNLNILFVSHQGVLFNIAKRIFKDTYELQQKNIEYKPFEFNIEDLESKLTNKSYNLIKSVLIIQKFLRGFLTRSRFNKLTKKLRLYKRKIPMGGLLLFYDNDDTWPKPINF